MASVQTLICVIKIHGPNQLSYHLNLLSAAQTADVKRFALAEEGLGPVADGTVDIIGIKIPVWKACLDSGLEVSRFCCGGFVDPLTLRDPRPEALSSAGARVSITHGFWEVSMVWDGVANASGR